MSEEIKRCPHCGGVADLEWDRRAFPMPNETEVYVRVVCEVCGASGQPVDFPHGKPSEVGWDFPECDRAVRVWNMRRADEKYESLMKEVLSAVGSLRDIVEQRANREDGEPLPGEVMPGIKA